MPALVLKVSLRLEASGLSGFGSFKSDSMFWGLARLWAFYGETSLTPSPAHTLEVSCQQVQPVRHPGGAGETRVRSASTKRLESGGVWGCGL